MNLLPIPIKEVDNMWYHLEPIIKKAVSLTPDRIDTKDLYECILLKFENVKYDEDQPIKMVHGPIKVSISFFNITPRLSIKENKDDKKNNYLFLTNKFLKNNKINEIVKKYLIKIVEYAYLDKLEKKLLAPKLIDQVF